MLPILLQIGSIKIYTFGIFLVLAFFWGSFLLWKVIRLTAFKEEDIFDGLFITLFGALIIGRFIYVVFNFSNFGFDLFKFILITGYPGLSLYGALLGGFTTLYIYASQKKIKFLELIDYAIPPLFLSFGLGFMGSFFSGSEAGIVTKFIVSMHYVGMVGQRQIPAFYESVLFFIGLWISYQILFSIRRNVFTKGFNLLFGAWYFAAIYFVFDKLKLNHLYFLNQSLNKIASLVLLLTTSFYFVYYFRSLIKNRLSGVTALIHNYGKKTYQGIHTRTKGKTPKGKGKNSDADVKS